ncbi:MAG: ATPase, T2SS/T4P/T4SS family, partial [Gammaproteobacteria bacterium]
MEKLEEYLKKMKELNASDLFVTVGIPLSMKIDGFQKAIDETVLNPEAVEQLLLPSMNAKQQAEFTEKNECNFALQIGDFGRFRVNIFRQRLHMGAVIRRIETKIPTVEELGVPNSLLDIVMNIRGLIILVGATGAGKSSTLAAMMGHRNHHSKGHIITIEDPIEFVHEHAGCIIT